VDNSHVKRILALVTVAAAAVALGATASGLWAATATLRAASTPKASRPLKAVPSQRVDRKLVRNLRSTTWRWEALIGLRRSHSAAPLRSERALRFWQARSKRVRRIAARPPHRSAWLCIHRYEGGWGDSGDPYWGGLQMDRSFMRSYATPELLRRGWADRWTPLEQMWVAERAHRRGRGFYPWPNTARYCNLI
jgi:hypothetical protein